jgi:N-acetylmuramoyl-L-alanine amidase
LAAFLVSAAVQAGELASWRFDAGLNRLLFSTRGGGVQPKAQLIFNPTRVVIDLQGISLERKTANQKLRDGFREVRVGQLDDRTTRIVVELERGYMIDPKEVKFRGATASQWTVDFPKPEQVESKKPND